MESTAVERIAAWLDNGNPDAPMPPTVAGSHGRVEAAKLLRSVSINAELLAACEATLELADANPRPDGFTPRGREVYDMLRAAIAKAKGDW